MGEAEPGAGADKVNRPENTKFKQQKLDAWQPILTPAWVIGTFFFVGVVFVPVGAYLWKLSSELFEASVTYDSYDKSYIPSNVPAACQIGSVNQGYQAVVSNAISPTACNVEFTFTQDIADSNPVYLYYELAHFYQNHRRYVKSLSESQIQNTVFINPVTNVQDTDLETACDPKNKSFSTNFGNSIPNVANRMFYPCGLIALSYFNDGISISGYSAPNNETAYSYVFGVPSSADAPSLQLDTDQIAWSTDLENKFRNPTATNCTNDNNNPGGNLCPIRYYQYQYLWQTYNQFMCFKTQNGTSNGIPLLDQPSPCVTYTDYVTSLIAQFDAANPGAPYDLSGISNKTVQGSCAKCLNSGDAYVSLGGIQMPPQDQLTDPLSDNGLRTPGFAVWMRIAGLPTFRKLVAKITPPPGGFLKGSKLSFQVIPNFLVSTVGATKSLVLMTSSELGGKNDILGIAYMSVGAICLFLAIVFAIKLKISPRKLGDPQYLQWKNK